MAARLASAALMGVEQGVAFSVDGTEVCAGHTEEIEIDKLLIGN